MPAEYPRMVAEYSRMLAEYSRMPAEYYFPPELGKMFPVEGRFCRVEAVREPVAPYIMASGSGIRKV